MRDDRLAAASACELRELHQLITSSRIKRRIVSILRIPRRPLYSDKRVPAVEKLLQSYRRICQNAGLIFSQSRDRFEPGISRAERCLLETKHRIDVAFSLERWKKNRSDRRYGPGRSASFFLTLLRATIFSLRHPVDLA